MVGPCADCMPLLKNHMTATDAITNASAGQYALGGASDGERLPESGFGDGGASVDMTGFGERLGDLFLTKHSAAKVVLGANAPDRWAVPVLVASSRPTPG